MVATWHSYICLAVRNTLSTGAEVGCVVLNSGFDCILPALSVQSQCHSSIDNAFFVEISKCCKCIRLHVSAIFDTDTVKMYQ